MNYWVQQRGEILGPFSFADLQQMAAERKVRPDDKVSTDQHHWVIAARVPGLMTLKYAADDVPPEDEAKQFRAVAVDETQTDDEGDDEYRLSPEEDPPPRHLEVEQETKPAGLPVGIIKRVEIPQQSLGLALGGLAAVVFVVFSVPAAGIVNALLGGRFETAMLGLSLVAAVAGLGLFIAAAMGTSNTLEVDVTKAGIAHVTLSRQVAYVGWSRWQSYVVEGDRLEKRVKMKLGMFTDATAGDIAALLLLVSCCGGLPGALIWLYGFRSGAGEENTCQFRLVLCTRENPAPVTLYSEKVSEYFATRFGEPTLAGEMIQLLQAAVPGLEVCNVED